MTEDDIKARLLRLGFSQDELPRIMYDVGAIILGKAMAAYMPTLSEEQKLELAALPSEDVARYFEEKKATFPSMPQHEFDAIHDETWRDYFKAMS